MDKIVFRLVANGKCLSRMETHPHATLEEIRKRIENELADLVPVTFTFLYKNITITKKQECRLTVRQCSEKDNSNAVYDLTLRLAEKSPVSSHPVDSSNYCDLRLISDDECIAFLPSTQLDMKLIGLRKRLNDEVPDILPINFKFTFRGVKLGKNQESKMTVCQCSKMTIVNSKSVHDLTISEHIDDMNLAAADVPFAQSSSSTIWRRNKIQLYTQDEIQSGTCWLEKERMSFWNLKADELQRSKETIHFTKQELIGAIDTSWVFKKVDLLKLRILDLDVQKKRYRDVFNEDFQRATQSSKKSTTVIDLPQSVVKHEDEMSRMVFFIKNEHKEILRIKAECEGRNLAKRVDEKEQLIHDYLHQLKRSSDSLLKAIYAHEVKVHQFADELLGQNDQNDRVPELDSCEIDNLVVQTITERLHKGN